MLKVKMAMERPQKEFLTRFAADKQMKNFPRRPKTEKGLSQNPSGMFFISEKSKTGFFYSIELR